MTVEQQELARQARNRYAREWRAKNKDKVRANNVRYWARQAEKHNEGSEKESASPKEVK